MDCVDPDAIAGCRTLHRNRFREQPYASLRAAIASQPRARDLPTATIKLVDQVDVVDVFLINA
jgi:hypothetical protein